MMAPPPDLVEPRDPPASRSDRALTLFLFIAPLLAIAAIAWSIA